MSGKRKGTRVPVSYQIFVPRQKQRSVLTTMLSIYTVLNKCVLLLKMTESTANKWRKNTRFKVLIIVSPKFLKYSFKKLYSNNSTQYKL